MLHSALLYTALVIGANTAFAGEVDWQAAKDAGMVKLVPSEDAPSLPDTSFTDPDGGAHSLADYKGKVVLLNFWATWCAPCREEMPSLDALQTELGGDEFEVVPIATGRNAPAKIESFFEETGVSNLPVLLDPRQKLAREMGVVGLPVSVLIDRDGKEVARLLGDADWASEPAKQVIRQLTAD
ncbi:TlpA disulfide reductase family protein [Paracoccus salsus]|uniref:TlpA disulfide reductase family protein n=1 Tax=Paracoccus salsus TaxID=2911061 RepID=UPI001F4797CA|nr:TlpA disulfide reductase family protein [Paracoccus salsus]MCF3973017.1 TlpA family protein disulfide reductase [Paracoccus salsus]